MTPKSPASVVGFYPGTDVSQMWKDDVAGTREAAEMFTGGTPEQYPDRYREVSPTSDIRPGLPRTLLVVGDRDRSARPETITDFGDARGVPGGSALLYGECDASSRSRPCEAEVPSDLRRGRRRLLGLHRCAAG
ncbi:hypothetical protein [Streptomyces xantholiticus]|uniref:Uncharacterized protein n=1 Tax=Streptomyces xantholiticus TaxID=68285 RepID=A0ABV1V454_9ACTN